jgi:hypothetical protein
MGCSMCWYESNLPFKSKVYADYLVAGGGAYYFAKKSINADRTARFEAEQRRRRIQESLEYSANAPSQTTTTSGIGGSVKNGGSPGRESTLDPAAAQHAPDPEGQRLREKSKYETNEPFRAKKGDRFS